MAAKIQNCHQKCFTCAYRTEIQTYDAHVKTFGLLDDYEGIKCDRDTTDYEMKLKMAAKVSHTWTSVRQLLGMMI